MYMYIFNRNETPICLFMFIWKYLYLEKKFNLSYMFILNMRKHDYIVSNEKLFKQITLRFSIDIKQINKNNDYKVYQ